jgi:hypothetical protein
VWKEGRGVRVVRVVVRVGFDCGAVAECGDFAVEEFEARDVAVGGEDGVACVGEDAWGCVVWGREVDDDVVEGCFGGDNFVRGTCCPA